VNVDTIVAPVKQNGASMIFYTMQLPLKVEAIQITVGGPIAKRDELGKIADGILDSLEGETNW